MRKIPLITAVATAAIAVLGLAPAVAQASPVPNSARTFAPVQLHGKSAAQRRHGYNENGYNWSGWAVQGSGFTSVSASWTEPAVTCNSTNDLFAPWIGIDGYGSNSVEQTGVATDCSSGSPEYAAWYEVYPAAPVYYSNAVSAGDSFTATVNRSGTSYTLRITDNTRGWTKTTTQSYAGANASAEFILESPTGAYPSFGSVQFTGCTIDGAPLANYGGVALDASNSSGYEDRTSPVSNGTDFTVTYLQE